MKKPAALGAVSRRLAPNQRELAAAVALAESDPAAYVRGHRKQLGERRITTAVPDLAWLALVDGLSRAELLVEVDWKEVPEEVMAGLDRVIVARGFDGKLPRERWDWYDLDTFAERPLAAFLKTCGGFLATSGLALVELDIRSDCHPLTIVRTADVARLVADVKRAGHRIVNWKGPAPKARKPVAMKAEEIALPLEGDDTCLRVGDHVVMAKQWARAPHTVWLDASSWPPAIRRERGAVGWAAVSRGGRWAAIRDKRIVVGDGPKRMTKALPFAHDARYLAFVGERLVVFPWKGDVPPHLEHTGTLVPAQGLRASAEGQQGGVRVGTADLIVHDHAVWRLAGERFVRASTAVLGDGRNYWDACPDETGFAYFSSTRTAGRLEHVRLSGGARRIAVRNVHPWSVARPGPAGSTLLAFHEPVDACFGALVFESHRIVVPLPRKLLGKYTPGCDTYWLETAQRLVVVMWSSVLAIGIDMLRALPQRNLTTGKLVAAAKRVRW